MKIWMALLVVHCCYSSLFSQARFVATLDEARELAAASQQYIVLDVSADWCPPCQRMAEEVYPDPEFADYSKTRIFMVVDAYKDAEGRKLSSRFRVESFPTFILLDAEGTEIERFSGGRSTAGLIEDIDLILEDPRPFKEIALAAEDSPQDFELQFRAGRRAMGRKNYQRARGFLARAEELVGDDDPRLNSILVARYRAAFEDEAFDEALQVMERLNERSPAYRSSTSWQLQQARALISLERYDDAIPILNDALKADTIQHRAEARAIFDRLPKKYRRHEKELQKILEKAGKSLEKEKYAEAIEHAHRALEMDSSHPAVYLALARAWILSSAAVDGEESSRQYATGLRNLRLARCLDRNDYLSWAEARRLLAPDSARHAPNNEKARKKYLKAEEHFAARRFSEAANDYIEVLQIEPDFARGYLHLGDCHFATGNYENALKLFQEAARRAPRDASAYRFTADALDRLDRADEAYQWLIEALIVDPEYPLVWPDLQSAVSGSKGYERHDDLVPPRLAVAGPEDDYEALVRDLPPRTAAAWMEYVNHRLYWKSARFSEQFPEAASYFSSAREERECLEKLVERWDEMKWANPDLRDDKLDFIREVAIEGHLDTLVFLEMFSEQYRPEYQSWLQDNRQRIGEYLEHFIFNMPIRRAGRRDDGVSSSAVRAYNAGARLDESSPEEAIDHYRRALAHAPRYVSALSNLSWLYKKLERWDEAVELIERWIEVEPESYRPYDHLSLAEYRRGNRDKAVEAIKKALELVEDPEQRARLESNLAVFQRLGGGG